MVSYTLEEAPKKVQYIIIDSKFINGSKNNFDTSIDLSSNIFLQEMKDVVGVRLVDFYITQVGDADSGSSDTSKYVDIVCPEIPTAAQMLSERHPTLFARIPLERNYQDTSSVVYDKQWKGQYRKSSFFNPISLKKLTFKIYELQGDGDYVLLTPGSEFFMVLEVHTLDHKAPPPEPERRMEKILKKLSEKIDQLNLISKIIYKDEIEKKDSKKIPFHYVIIVIGLLLGALWFFMGRGGAPPPPVPVMT